MDLLRSLPIGLYLEQPVTWLHRIDARVKVGWLLLFGTLVTLLLLVMPDGIAVSQQPRLPTAELLNSWPEGLEAPESLPAVPPVTDYRYDLVDWPIVNLPRFNLAIHITQRSLRIAIKVSTLVFTLIYSTTLFLLTTAPEEITEGLEDLMQPLRWTGLPITEIALTLTLALRFIPLVLEEVQNLVRSVRTRAIKWKKLGVRGAVQIGLMVCERLVENLLLRASQIASAMKVRGFTSPNTHRVVWHSLKLHWWDWIVLSGLGLFWWSRIAYGGVM